MIMSCAIVNIYFFIQLKQEITHTIWISVINSTAVQLNISTRYCMQPSKVFKSVFNFFQVMAQRHFSWTQFHLKLLLPSDWSHTTSSASVQLLEVPYDEQIGKVLRVKKKKLSQQCHQEKCLWNHSLQNFYKHCQWRIKLDAFNAHPASFVPMKLWTEYMN